MSREQVIQLLALSNSDQYNCPTRWVAVHIAARIWRGGRLQDKFSGRCIRAESLLTTCRNASTFAARASQLSPSITGKFLKCPISRTLEPVWPSSGGIHREPVRCPLRLHGRQISRMLLLLLLLSRFCLLTTLLCVLLAELLSSLCSGGCLLCSRIFSFCFENCSDLVGKHFCTL